VAEPLRGRADRLGVAEWRSGGASFFLFRKRAEQQSELVGSLGFFVFRLTLRDSSFLCWLITNPVFLSLCFFFTSSFSSSPVMHQALNSALASRRQYIDNSFSKVSLGTGDRHDPSTSSLYSSSSSSSSSSSKWQFGSFVDLPPHGFRGILNQGATCYLNSFLQSLYMTPEFRLAVYQYSPPAAILSSSTALASSIPYHLQLLFLHLQFSLNGAASTRSLTTSFGWASEDVYQQEDINELYVKLFDALEKTCRASRIEEVIQGMFKGHLNDYVHCTKCGTRRERPDLFLSLCLNVAEQSSLASSLKDYLRAGETSYTFSNTLTYIWPYTHFVGMTPNQPRSTFTNTNQLCVEPT